MTAAVLNGECRAVPADGLRLNLGSGLVNVEGFVNLDIKRGEPAYPLTVEDGSVDEILASHVLEHYSHLQVSEVLQHWVAKLKPGGRIRLAVPDFEHLAKSYIAGEVCVQGYIMGGHLDEHDRHGCIFDRESLTELMIQCGLERITRWESSLPGGSSLPCSLNLQGYRPLNPTRQVVGVRACLSVPRFGPLLHPRCAERAFMQLGIHGQSGQSCFWHQKISNLMETAISHADCRYVLTLDYDTVFSAGDILELYRLLESCPEVDAVFPLQAKRGCQEALFSLTDQNGYIRTQISEADLRRNLLPANTGHFGLTLFRADSLRKFPRPWMIPIPAEDGRWDNGQIDADIVFWDRFKTAGFKVCLAPRVVVGHIEEVVTWPGKGLRHVYQPTADYEDNGPPPDAGPC